MAVPGIIIEDGEGNILMVDLPDILEEIEDGNSYYWNILKIWATGDIGDQNLYGFHDEYYEEEINRSKDGFMISWEHLNLLGRKFEQTIEIILLGSKDKSALYRYKNEQEMYETCDIVIIMFDSCYWQIYSKDKKLIDRFAKKFNEITLIDSSDKKWQPLF